MHDTHLVMKDCEFNVSDDEPSRTRTVVLERATSRATNKRANRQIGQTGTTLATSPLSAQDSGRSRHHHFSYMCSHIYLPILQIHMSSLPSPDRLLSPRDQVFCKRSASRLQGAPMRPPKPPMPVQAGKKYFVPEPFLIQPSFPPRPQLLQHSDPNPAPLTLVWLC